MIPINKEKNVIYSFKGKWLEPILNGDVRVFFRKRFPKEKPDRVYLYVGSPTSAIIGWAEVHSLSRVEAGVAINMSKYGAIDRSELSKYLDGSEFVGVFEIGEINIFRKKLSVSDVRHVFNFHPPQNFVQIDECDAVKLDGLGK